MGTESGRIKEQWEGAVNWRLWGPYLSERAWGTVREDYSPYGEAWDYFSHDQARSRAYRWNEDGLGGISDEKQRLCLALSLWNGCDPILKERAFGLTGSQGNHGEDVKESYFYLDATPTHSYMKYLYKYPQTEYPYALVVDENRRRGRKDPPFSLMDTGAFAENRYWDIEVVYAKDGPEKVLVWITVHNRGPEAATIHLLPTLWFRNTWSWGGESEKPVMSEEAVKKGAAWCVTAEHPELGAYRLFGAQKARTLFTENETNLERLWGVPNKAPYVKDAFHRHVVNKEEQAVNPEKTGTKFAAWHMLEVPAGSSAHIDLVLTSRTDEEPFKDFDKTVEKRKAEADELYSAILPSAAGEDLSILRQAAAGLIWSQQFFHYDVARWLDGDEFPPPAERKWGRNHLWRHLKAADVISMPDAWEYPWFAAWDLAFHCVALSLCDMELAKRQVELLLSERYLHPSGQIPAYEWAFADVNPPVQAWAALEVFRADRRRTGKGDLAFLRRVFNKLLLNFGWWLNRKDPESRSVFEGGFLGLDNISVYDRSQPLPPGYSLKQADATGWMAMFILNLTAMALELAVEEPEYEEMAIQIHGQFFAMSNAVHGYNETGVALWDYADSFFKDVLVGPQGQFPLSVFSWVGLIPLFACEIIGPDRIENLPRYNAFLNAHAMGKYDGHFVCACPATVNPRKEHLFSLLQPANLPAVMKRVLDETEFLSPHGIRALSRIHETRSDLGTVPGLGMTMIKYEPGESESGLFGGNSNWRGPSWFPLNYLLVQSLDRFHQYLGDSFMVQAPFKSGDDITLGEAADEIARRLVGIFRRDKRGIRPAFPEDSPFQSDPHWRDLLLFHEYFHAETGQGIGAAHQTGWTALAANLIEREYARKAKGIKVGHEWVYPFM